MTIAKYTLHNNLLEKIENNINKTIDISMWDPKRDNIENHTDIDPDIADKMPFKVGDSRQLLDNKVHTDLSIDEQLPIRNKIIVIINDALQTADHDSNESKRQQIYNLGIKEALTASIEHIKSGVNLYELADYYKKLAFKYKNMLIDEPDTEELEYPQTRFKGSASGFFNLYQLIEYKLAEETMTKYKQNLVPVVR